MKNILFSPKIKFITLIIFTALYAIGCSANIQQSDVKKEPTATNTVLLQPTFSQTSTKNISTVTPIPTATDIPREYYVQKSEEVKSKLPSLIILLKEENQYNSSPSIFTYNKQKEEYEILTELTGYIVDIVMSGNGDLLLNSNENSSIPVYAIIMPNGTLSSEGLPILGGQTINKNTAQFMEDNDIILGFTGTVMPTGAKELPTRDAYPQAMHELNLYQKGIRDPQEAFFISFSNGTGVTFGLSDEDWLEVSKTIVPDTSVADMRLRPNTKEIQLYTLDNGYIGYNSIYISIGNNLHQTWYQLSEGQSYGPFWNLFGAESYLSANDFSD